tara:strand:- start:105 stop:695 length:591 start_codon:yes stop_codon:yes gene_type:complete
MSDLEAETPKEESLIPKELESQLKELAISEAEPSVEIKVEEVEELTGELESKKPKVKRERTEKQKAVFEKARLARAANVAKRKAEKEASKKPRGRPKKEPEPEPEPELEEEVSDTETVVEEEIEYRKKPKKQFKPTKKVKKIVYISDDSDDSESSDDEEFIAQIQRLRGKKPQQQYQVPQQQYQAPTTMSNFYNFQ